MSKKNPGDCPNPGFFLVYKFFYSLPKLTNTFIFQDKVGNS